MGFGKDDEFEAEDKDEMDAVWSLFSYLGGESLLLLDVLPIFH